MKNLILLFVVIALIGAFYFMKYKPDQEKAAAEKKKAEYDKVNKTEQTKPAPTPEQLVETPRPPAPTVKTADSQIKPMPILKTDKVFIDAVVQFSKDLYGRETEYQNGVLMPYEIGKKLVTTEGYSFVDDFLISKNGGVNYADIMVKPKFVFPTDIQRLQDIHDLMVAGGSGRKGSLTGEQVQTYVKGDIKNITGIDLLHGKKGDASMNTKAGKERAAYIIDWLDMYIKESARAEYAAKKYAEKELIAAGWNIATNSITTNA